MQPNSRALKIQARNAMSDTSPSFWTVTLLYVLLVTVLPNLLYEIFNASLLTLVMEILENPNSLLDSALIGLFVSLVVQLVSMVVQLGYYLWALRCWRREDENGFGSLFEGFGMVGRLLLCNVIVLLNILGWSVLLITALSTVLSPILFMDSSPLTYIFMALYGVSAFVASFLIFLRYTLVPFVLLDRPELGVFQVIALSVSMMRRRLWTIFRLYFSFFWWYLLGFVLSWGVSLLVIHLGGQLLPNLYDYLALLSLTSQALPYWLGLAAELIVTLFLTPYVTITIAGFYDSLIQPPPVPENPFHNEIY